MTVFIIHLLVVMIRKVSAKQNALPVIVFNLLYQTGLLVLTFIFIGYEVSKYKKPDFLSK